MLTQVGMRSSAISLLFVGPQVKLHDFELSLDNIANKNRFFGIIVDNSNVKFTVWYSNDKKSL